MIVMNPGGVGLVVLGVCSGVAGGDDWPRLDGRQAAAKALCPQLRSSLVVLFRGKEVVHGLLVCNMTNTTILCDYVCSRNGDGACWEWLRK